MITWLKNHVTLCVVAQCYKSPSCLVWWPEALLNLVEPWDILFFIRHLAVVQYDQCGRWTLFKSHQTVKLSGNRSRKRGNKTFFIFHVTLRDPWLERHVALKFAAPYHKPSSYQAWKPQVSLNSRCKVFCHVTWYVHPRNYIYTRMAYEVPSLVSNFVVFCFEECQIDIPI